MANQSPLSGLSDAAGGILLPTEQGEILTEGILQEAGALSLAGDKRTTRSRKEVFGIWQGQPTAAFVAEAGTKPVTGAEFGAGTLTIQKIAVICVFTDEMLDDVQNGDLNVLVDGGIRSAIAGTADYDAVNGSNFDSALVDSTSSVAMGTAPDALGLAISAARGSLEANGYGNPANQGVLLTTGFAQHIRDAAGGGTIDRIYDNVRDPLYGLQNAVTSNLPALSGTTASDVVAFVVHKPNLHVRIRQDVTVKPSTEAVVDGVSLYQNDETALRYVTQLGFFVHDLNDAVVKITRA